MTGMNRLVLFLLLSGVVGCATEGGTELDQELDHDLAALQQCFVAPACTAPPPDPGPKRSFSKLDSWLTATFNAAQHRGRDQVVAVGQPQWIIGRLAYGLGDTPLTDEEVDLYLLRGCGSSWEKLATLKTTKPGSHPTVEGVADDGGRVYWQVPAGKTLAPGRHRVRLVVAGDLTATELVIEVVPPDSRFFVSDVDGTLTTWELEEFFASLSNSIPNANPDSAARFQALVAKGYRPFYLTARPERLATRTREFLAARGYPAGTVHTTLGNSGLIGPPAAEFKLGEIIALESKGFEVVGGFGNTDTDAKAYADAGLAGRFFFRYSDSANNGQRFENYADLTPVLAGWPAVCQ
jgi:hypothetical protein